MIRVGRISYSRDNRYGKIPTYEGFPPIVVLMKSSEYGSLGPYCLKDDEGRYMENIYQFSKIYEYVPAHKEPYSHRPEHKNNIIWEYGFEEHIINNKIVPEYWNWRHKGMYNQYAVRHPIDKRYMRLCKWSMRDEFPQEKLSYVDAHKLIYFHWYSRLVRQQKQFTELKQRHEKGENLLILEVDGPHGESSQYYKSKYNVSDLIDNDTMLVTERNIQIMCNDTKHPFGHGYCLAVSLLGADDWVTPIDIKDETYRIIGADISRDNVPSLDILRRYKSCPSDLDSAQREDVENLYSSLHSSEFYICHNETTFQKDIAMLDLFGKI